MAASKRVFYASLIVLVICSIGFYPFGIQVTKHTLNHLLENPNLVSLIAMIQVFESVFLIIISVLHIKGHYRNNTKIYISSITLVPSLIFIIGVFFLQSYCYLSIESFPFIQIALLFSLSLGLIVYTSASFVRYLLPYWELRAELKILTSLFQILLAMFLPLIIKGVEVPFSNLTIAYKPIVIATSIVISLVSLGFGINWWKEKKYFNSKMYKS
tara:strand:- start:6300 stop:6941 length:642 start_codon:yes stop_codon:yes gene_type:complete